MTALNSTASALVQEDVPIKDLTIKDIVKSLPQDCLKQDPLRAWCSVGVSILCLGLGYTGLFFSPWYLWVPLWIFTGTALTGFFILGHDCGHYSFSDKRWVNEWVGHLIMLPLLYPFHNWRLQHNAHHRFTNKLGGERWKQIQDVLYRRVDIAWYPLRPEVWNLIAPRDRLIYRFWRERLWWLESIPNWWYELHLKPSTLSPDERFKVRFSSTLVYIFSVIGLGSLFYVGGIVTVIKFWFIPWLVFHFWFSTFTRLQHTDSDIHWRSEQDWNLAEAQLCGTIYCHYPRWIEFLCHDVNVHIPHHLSIAIPHYNLRKAHASLKSDWGMYMKEKQFSWSLFKEMAKLNLYCPKEQNYLSFSELK